MKKVILSLCLLVIMSASSLALNSYFFLTSTIQQGTDKDSAKVICEKYTQGKFQIYYGNNVGVCAIQCAIDPDITEIVVMKSRAQIISLVHPNLPEFNGAVFIQEWEKIAN